MPKEELRFLWKISLALFCLGRGGRTSRLTVLEEHSDPPSGAARAGLGEMGTNGSWLE